MAEDEDTAKKIAFGNDFGRFNCVTIKGDKYNPAGTLEGGFKRDFNMLRNVQMYQELTQRQITLSESMKKVNQELQVAESELRFVQERRMNLESMKSKLEHLENNEFDGGNDEEKRENLAAEIENLR